MKKSIKRMITMLTAVMSMAIILCCTAVTASAADVKPVASVSNTATASISASPISYSLSITNNNNVGAINKLPGLKMQQQGQGGVSNGTADSAYQSVVEFIIKWLKRAGFLLGFFGAAMLFMAMKNEDADGKQRGLLTLIAGFGLAALCIGADMFDLFS